MKKSFFAVILSLTALSVNAQTSAELIGKWKLVKLIKGGKEKPISAEYKTDQVFQIFQEDGKFISLVGDQQRVSKWKLSDDGKKLTIINLIITVPFSVDYFDAKKRIITSDAVGTLEYQKVDQ
jgi:hypothetical protein